MLQSGDHTRQCTLDRSLQKQAKQKFEPINTENNSFNFHKGQTGECRSYQ